MKHFVNPDCFNMANSQVNIDEENFVSSDENNDEKINKLMQTLEDFNPPSQRSHKRRGRTVASGKSTRLSGLQEFPMATFVGILNDFRNELKKLNLKLDGITSELKNFNGRLCVLEESFKPLKYNYESLDKRINELELRFEDIEQEKRNLNLLLHINDSPPQDEYEESIKKILTDKIEVEGELIEGIVITRFGRTKNIFSLMVPNFRVKGRLFACIRRTKPKDIYLSEYLVSRREKLMKDLRLRKKNGELASVFTYNGQVFVKLTQNSQKIKISNINDLNLAK